MEKLSDWVAAHVERMPTLVAVALVALSIVLAACGGKGGGSGY